MRPEYDFSQLKGRTRGKYAERYKAAFGPKPAAGLNGHGEGYELTSAFPLAATNGKMSRQEEAVFISRMVRELTPVWVTSVTPIFAGNPNGREFFQCGTGTLFRIADKSFLVTASHVVTEAESRKFGLYISDAPSSVASRSRSVPLQGRVSGHNAKRYDVCIWELPADVVAALGGRTFLSIHRADRQDRRLRLNGIYSMYGYPECWSQVRMADNFVDLTPIRVVAQQYQGDSSRMPDYDFELNLLLSLESAPENLPDSPAGSPPPLWHGISGCPIWQLSYEGLPSKLWTPNDAVIVGVQTGVSRNGTIIKGTRWWVVEAIIRHAYPELTEPLDLVTSTV